MFDIHSHILPSVDDGAKDLDESVSLLESLKNQGVTDVMATPHFYPYEHSLSEFKEVTTSAYNDLLKAIDGKDLPKVHLGCEILYFDGLAFSEDIEEFCLANSKYILIELTDKCITDTLFQNILHLKNNTDLVPIIAHAERYHRSKNFRKLINFLEYENITVQINASSFLEWIYNRAIAKLFKADLSIIIGSDAHSMLRRPPLIDKAIEVIIKKYGKDTADIILRNTENISKKILSNGENQCLNQKN
ncbi:MAG: hypothetical protein J6D52_13795 [Clostridia bacterium]|nr:hypothetical protein [Clostridia bacterium]